MALPDPAPLRKMSAPLLTLIIPTFNRPELLRRTLWFVRRASDAPIIVTDASDSIRAEQNARTCTAIGGATRHLSIPSPEDPEGKIRNYRDRLVEAIRRVRTPHVTMCADDDFILMRAARRCADFLERDDGFIACHGLYAGFQSNMAGIEVASMVYQAPSIDADEVSARLMQLYSQYEATFYAVYRVPIQERIFEAIPTDLEKFLQVEATQSALTAATGRVKRLDDLYYLRNLGVAPLPRDLEGWNQWMAQDFDGFYAAYRRHRGRVLASVESSATEEDLERLRRAIDMSFLLHVGLEFHLGFWIDEYLATCVKGETERGRIGRAVRHRLLGIAPPPPARDVEGVGRSDSADWRRRIRRAGRVVVGSMLGEAGVDRVRTLMAALRRGAGPRKAQEPLASAAELVLDRPRARIDPGIARRFPVECVHEAQAELDRLVAEYR